MHQASLNRYLFFSTTLHLACLLCLLVILPAVNLPKPPESISVVMVELPIGKSEDIGLGIPATQAAPTAPLPKEVPIPPTTQPPPAKPPMTEQTPAKPIAKPKPAQRELSPAERKMRDALNKVAQDLHNRNHLPPTAQAQNPSEGFKYGTTTKPLSQIPPDAELMRYRAMVRARILREWIAPTGIRDLPPNVRPSVRISVRISADGHVTSTGWAKKSDNPSFDASAMRAVQRASPLPAPPESVREMALAQGFTIDFVVR